MNLLTRNNIIKLIKTGDSIISDDENFFVRDIDSPYTNESHIQQCSIDLHVGKIYVPDVDAGQSGSMENPITSTLSLKAGNTILIRTKEKIKLPENIAGICFAPSRITLKGVMITNMGHVDPGYNGHLHFTVINMGKTDYSLRPKDIICTMLLIQLKESTTPYGDEHYDLIGSGSSVKKIPAAINRNLPRLSRDLANFEKRAEEVAEKVSLKYAMYTLIVPIIVALVIAGGPVIERLFPNKTEKEILSINNKISKIQDKINYQKDISKIENEKTVIILESKIKEIENKLKSLSPNKQD